MCQNNICFNTTNIDALIILKNAFLLKQIIKKKLCLPQKNYELLPKDKSYIF